MVILIYVHVFVVKKISEYTVQHSCTGQLWTTVIEYFTESRAEHSIHSLEDNNEIMHSKIIREILIL